MARRKSLKPRTPREEVGIERGDPITWRYRLKPLAELRASDVPRGLDPEDVSIEHTQFHREHGRED